MDRQEEAMVATEVDFKKKQGMLTGDVVNHVACCVLGNILS